MLSIVNLVVSMKSLPNIMTPPWSAAARHRFGPRRPGAASLRNIYSRNVEQLTIGPKRRLAGALEGDAHALRQSTIKGRLW